MTSQSDSRTGDSAPTPSATTHLTSNLPKIGGHIKESHSDFLVEEIPAYEPSGQGPHYYLWIEKSGVDGRRLLKILSQSFGVSRRDIGTAGTKDRRAITRQWVSLPVDAVEVGQAPEPGSIAAGVEILQVSRHRNKLRTGHLKGNRFSVIIGQTQLRGQELKDALRAVASELRRSGMPNYYGSQRFGDRGSTLVAGWKWLVEGQAPRGRFLRRMAASALQSEVFNRVLNHRLRTRTWKKVMPGDIFERVDSGGRFWIDESERAETQRRLDAGEIVVTGPMPGNRGGLAEKDTGQLERRIMNDLGVRESMLDAFGNVGKGTRRAMTVYLEGLDFELEGDDAVRLEFSLPSGSYATVLVAEFCGEINTWSDTLSGI